MIAVRIREYIVFALKMLSMYQLMFISQQDTISDQIPLCKYRYVSLTCWVLRFVEGCAQVYFGCS